MTNATFVSLFCGAGGMDAGAIQAGLSPRLSIDIDFDSLTTHHQNFASPIVLADLSLDRFPIAGLSSDLLLAGPPCQAFSTAGKMDRSDKRALLIHRVSRAAEEIAPGGIVVENVPNAKRGDNIENWERLRSDLLDLGYESADYEVCASDAGVPQRRSRVFMIALKGHDPNELEFETRPQRTLGDALVGVEVCDDHDPTVLDGASTHGQIAKRVDRGRKLSNVRSGARNIHTWEIPEVFGSVNETQVAILEAILVLRRRSRSRTRGDGDPVTVKRLASHLNAPPLLKDDLAELVSLQYLRQTTSGFDFRSTFNGTYRRLSLNEPSLTVHTKFGNPRYFLHPVEHRGFSVREAARLQGFPDSFKFAGSKSSQYTQIGNAVPPPLAKVVVAATAARLGLEVNGDDR